MNLLQGIGNRINAVVGAVIGAILFFICGAVMAFVISPQQALEWRRIEGLPQLDATSFAGVGTGEGLAITGTLQGNAVLTEDGLVAYHRERWDVEPADPDSEDDTPDGTWTTIETVAPALNIAISGGTVSTIPASPSFGGNLHETMEAGPGPLSAKDGTETVMEGSIRTQGFYEGDLITVVGTKASTGGIAPDRFYAGDRVQLVEEIRTGARILFGMGIFFMVCSPVILVMGVVGAIFGRNRANRANLSLG